MTDDASGRYNGDSERVGWKAVCHEDGCRGISHGPYTIRRYARIDKNAHEEWHEQRGKTADVEVVKRPLDTEEGKERPTEIVWVEVSATVKAEVPEDASDSELLRAVREELTDGRRVVLEPPTDDDVIRRVEL